MIPAAMRVLLCVLFVLTGSAGKGLACHKKGHDCVTAIDVTNLRDLPFRVAVVREMFAKHSVYPDIRPTEGTERLSSMRSGQILLAILSPLEAAGLITKDAQFKIVSVLQWRPASLLVVSQKPSNAPIPLKQLEGTKITISLDSSDALYLTAAFSAQGVTAKGYSLVPLPRDQLLRGPVGAKSAALWDPLDALEASRLNLRAVSLSSYLVDEGLVAVLVGRTDLLKAESDGVIGLLRALTDAVGWINDAANRRDVINIIATAYTLTPEASTAVYDLVLQPKNRIFPMNLTPSPGLTKVTNQWLGGTGLSLQDTFFDLTYVKGGS